MRGGCLQPPNLPEPHRIYEELSASMRGGCLQPPNLPEVVEAVEEASASMRGGCLQPPNANRYHIADTLGLASMRGGCLQPPNPRNRLQSGATTDRFNEGGLSPAPEHNEILRFAPGMLLLQ